jgi:hypothetical protein
MNKHSGLMHHWVVEMLDLLRPAPRMSSFLRKTILTFCFAALAWACAVADIHTITIATPKAPLTQG